MSRPLRGGSARGLADAQAFLAEASAHPLFDPSREIVVARAPGRLDLMGGIADYSGALVLQWPLQEATLAAVQLVPERALRAMSLAPDPGSAARSCEAPLDALFPGGTPLTEDAARAWFALDEERRWAAYALGPALVLARERGVRFERGLRVLIRSAVPEGKGVSSSAALEVAAMQALGAALGLALDARTLAILCQRVENRIVGAACGVMDQMTASCGETHALLALLCQPAEIEGTLLLPDDLEIWGVDSGVRHAVSGSDYTSVRVAAFMGARIVAELLGLRVTGDSAEGRVRIEDPRWSGHLANVTPSELSSLPQRLPDAMLGRDFLARYGGTTDAVTRVVPDREYRVRVATQHPIHEHFRVRTFAELLAGPPTERSRALLGELMYQSHASYSACGLGCEATDLLVALVRESGSARGFFGAKITGGGSGGTVAVLGRKGADIAAIAEAFARRLGRRPRVFSGSSPGAAAFGSIRLGATPRGSSRSGGLAPRSAR